jgi:hypothetical protein
MGILTAQHDAELNRAGTSGMGHFRVSGPPMQAQAIPAAKLFSVRNCIKE